MNGDGKRFVREDLPFKRVERAERPARLRGWQVFDDTMFEKGMEDAVEEFKQRLAVRGINARRAGRRRLASTHRASPTPSRSTTGFRRPAWTRTSGRDLAGTIPFTGTRFFRADHEQLRARHGGRAHHRRFVPR